PVHGGAEDLLQVLLQGQRGGRHHERGGPPPPSAAERTQKGGPRRPQGSKGGSTIMAVTSQAVQAKNDLRIGDKIFTFLKYFLLILFSAIALIPVSVCVLTAFKTTDEYNTTNVLTPPENWLNFDNFVTAFERANMLRGFLNTGIALVFVLLFSILISSMLAYVLNRFRFPGSGLIH